MCRSTKPTSIYQIPINMIEKPILNRKRRRSTSVQFAVNDTISADATYSSFTSTWYDNEELESFRRDAKSTTLSSTFMQLIVEESRKKSRSMQLDEKEMLFQRRRRKHVAIKAVLEAQRRLKSLAYDKDEKLAEVSTQFSKWARDVARRVAVVEAYALESDLNDNNSNKRRCLSH